MTRYALGIVGVLAFSGLTLAGPIDMFEEKEKDFGVSPKGTILVHYFRFTNNTKETVTLGQPRVSCGCVTPALSKNQVAPGETAAVIAYMDTRRIPNAGVTKTVIVFVPFQSPTFEEVSLKVTTVTRDDLLMSPDVLAFGSVTKGKGAKASTKVTFTSDPNWTVNKATSTGAYVTPEFKLVSRNGTIVTYDVTATLDKDCPAGNWTSDVYLETSNSAVAKLRIPVTVNVTVPVAATPEAVTFGNVKVGTPAEQKLTIQGTAPFKILEVKGADDEVTVKIDKDSALPVHTLTIAAHPKAAGGFARTVEIVTDNKERPSVIVQVTGKVIEK
ncbi:DUF1573 domain-containing protein [Frigoriglobus tundricola]|uniref:DUF1573 domain-containing protein n=1 Tax=Frigoriglobus tundricola TaxID=2774151 RepID=A0A6M5Z2Q9_9BACT|nr:DUF1573 domain-containing protein [Frigoriglobus tundricola]QJW99721.1 hypothetical protein FTUN_7344 [Frigoriglobus tundricola]